MLNTNHKILIVFAALLFPILASAQHLKPQFDIREYIELLKLTAKNSELEFGKDIPYPEHFKLNYRSPVVGFDNVWELWKNDNNTAAISIRGSTLTSESWLANFYAAMVPAKGELLLSQTDTFHYQLAQNLQASVHVGWLISMAFLSRDIIPKIDSCYLSGIKDFYIVGHSQGGGISFLMTAYLYSLQKQNVLPPDIRFKTYCSAGPKPGNLFFAYEYEILTQSGWAYNVVNANDWVPELPFSIQTVNDLNPINPFTLADGAIKKQSFFKRLALRSVYNKLTKPAYKAQKYYQKYLGNMVSKAVQKHLKDLVLPGYANNNNYVRTGNSIILAGNDEYFKAFPNIPEQSMNHHSFYAYLFLAEKNESFNASQ